LFPRAATSLLIPAFILTLLNCAKPLVIDDTAYHFYAVQDAAHPLDPYGFAVYWWHRPYVANEVLAPPLLPYWWSLALRLFGEHPTLWKLWLLPFNLLLVGALHALFRRFARGLETPLVWLTVLSPALLPSLNLMLDVPALALALGALVVFLRACDRDSLALAALAGVLAALAIETKYTGALAPAAMLLYAVCFRKLGLWPAAALLAAQVFVSWEFLIALLYGQSHFLYALRENVSPLSSKFGLWLPLVGILGTIAPPAALLGLAALRVSGRTLILAGGAVVLAYALVAAAGVQFTAQGDVAGAPLIRNGDRPVDFTLELVVFLLVGLGVAGVAAAVAGRLGWAARMDVPLPEIWRRSRARWFLLLWLGLEVAGYFAMTPFPAVRRLLGVVVVGTLIAGHLAARTCRSPPRRRLVVGVAAYGVALGLGFYAVDLCEAWTEKAAAEQAATLIQEQGGGTGWYVGHWGFQFYAERAGMQPVVTAPPPQYCYESEGPIPLPPLSRPIPMPPVSQLKEGDWIVVPDYRVTQQPLYLDATKTEPVFWFAVRDPIPLRTVMCYYSGNTALEHRAEPTRLQVTVYRVTADFVPVH
jgi:hypothetical protein